MSAFGVYASCLLCPRAADARIRDPDRDGGRIEITVCDDHAGRTGAIAMTATIATVLLVALASGRPPAWSAARVDPMRALRRSLPAPFRSVSSGLMT